MVKKSTNAVPVINADVLGPSSMSSLSTSTAKIDFGRFDGSGRSPREVQTRFLEWLSDTWDTGNCFAGQLPVGSGKSALARTLGIVLGASIVTPSNVLIDQYCGDYPEHNYLKGKDRYQCAKSGYSCAAWTGPNFNEKPCVACPYQTCRERAKAEPTFFNPSSLYYFRLSLLRQQQFQRFPVLVVDEAHQLPQMLQLFGAKRFRRSLYQFDDNADNELKFESWLADALRRLDKLAQMYKNGHNRKKLQEIEDEMAQTALVLACLREDPQNYAIYFENGTYRGRKDVFLNVRPVRAPKNIVRDVLDCDKLVLISGTLLKTDIEDLAGDRTVKFIDLPSPIPKERRPILYRPTSFAMNVDTDPRLIVEWIERVLALFPGRNTVIHTTYSQSPKLLPHFTGPVFHNTAENKEFVLERFKREGGVFLAAGCAEGLDLKDDLCRLNIIPQLQRPNLADRIVAKRRALEGGERWYALETLKVAIQQAGRSTRHEKDDSVTVIGDPLFSSLVARYGKDLPQSFVEAMRWRL